MKESCFNLLFPIFLTKREVTFEVAFFGRSWEGGSLLFELYGIIEAKKKNDNQRRNVHSDPLLVCCNFSERKFNLMEKQDKRINSDRFAASALYIFVLFYLVYYYIETTLGIESQFKKDIIKSYTPTWFRYALVLELTLCSL